MRHATNLDVKNLTVRTRAGSHTVLSNVRLALRRGELTCIVGESGSGKTTVLSAILGLLPDALELHSGTLTLAATTKDEPIELVGLTSAARCRVLGRRISYVPQDCLQGLDPLMAVGRMLRASLRSHTRVSEADSETALNRAAREAGLPDGFLEEYAGRRPSALSGGQRQRVLLANARIHRPQVILYDEPTTALDPVAKRRVLDAIKACIGTEASALVVTHDLAPMARYADRAYVLYAGEVVESGTGQEVFHEPQHPYTQDLLRCLPRIDRRTCPCPIRGHQPLVSHRSSACRYCDRCSERLDRCVLASPDLKALGPTREVRCYARE